MAMHQGTAHNEKIVTLEGFGHQKFPHLRPRRIVELGKHHDVQCRLPERDSRILERACQYEGKYEEEREKEEQKKERESGYLYVCGVGLGDPWLIVRFLALIRIRHIFY
jgi:hypothetical protein